MIYGTQIIGTLFSLVMVYLTFLFYKRKEFGPIGLVSWMALWCGALFLIIFPQSFDRVIQPLNIGSVTQFLIVGSVMILFGFNFIGNIRMKNIEKKIDNFTRQIALGKLSRK